jgi:hypothetical protein
VARSSSSNGTDAQMGPGKQCPVRSGASRRRLRQLISPAYHYARKRAGMATAPVPIDRVKATETWLAAIVPEHPVIGMTG